MNVPFSEEFLVRQIHNYIVKHHQWNIIMEIKGNLDAMYELIVNSLIENGIAPIEGERFNIEPGLILSSFDIIYNRKQLSDNHERLIRTISSSYTIEQLNDFKIILTELKRITEHIYNDQHITDGNEHVQRKLIILKLTSFLAMTPTNVIKGI
jgi:hypothetical protein